MIPIKILFPSMTFHLTFWTVSGTIKILQNSAIVLCYPRIVCLFIYDQHFLVLLVCSHQFCTKQEWPWSHHEWFFQSSEQHCQPLSDLFSANYKMTRYNCLTDKIVFQTEASLWWNICLAQGTTEFLWLKQVRKKRQLKRNWKVNNQTNFEPSCHSCVLIMKAFKCNFI